MKRALITGGAGFVGRHMAHRLLSDGWAVQTVDLKPLDVDYLRPAPLESYAHEHWEGDVREWFLNDGTRWDLVIHCAANIAGRAAIDGDPLWVAENLELDTAMFRWAVATRQPRVVYYSSSAAYPVAHQMGQPRFPLDERDIGFDPRVQTEWMPDQTYGWAKLTGEYLATHARAAGVAVHVLRPFSGYGEDQDTSYPFGAFIERARKRADPFEIWGDGHQVRDWVHIDDVIGATLAVIDADYQEPVNVCTGRGVSMTELAGLICRAVRAEARTPALTPKEAVESITALSHPLREMQPSGSHYRPEIRYRPAAPNGPCVYRVGDPTRLKTIYKPQISLEQGIRRALDS